jgi:hypothetical protein
MVLGEKLITIRRLLPKDEIQSGGNTGNILKRMRGLVREARNNEPALADSTLYDIGLVRHDNAWEIKMYFFC